MDCSKGVAGEGKVAPAGGVAPVGDVKGEELAWIWRGGRRCGLETGTSEVVGGLSKTW